MPNGTSSPGEGGRGSSGQKSSGFWILALVVVALAVIPFAWAALGRSSDEAPAPAPTDELARLTAEVVTDHPHDPGSFTQGLLWHNGALYESAGRYGESELREVDLESGAVVKRLELAPEVFAEGLALVGNHLVQLTWQSGQGFVYDLETFDRVDRFDYDTEGWGLCFDGQKLFMSDGSDTLYLRSPVTYEVIDLLSVTEDGQPVTRLNELECVGDDVYANVWYSDAIYRIDGQTGNVTGVIDASGLLTPQESAGADVLNGIAYVPETDTFLITGKLWPRLFEVRFVPAAETR